MKRAVFVMLLALTGCAPERPQATVSAGIPVDEPQFTFVDEAGSGLAPSIRPYESVTVVVSRFAMEPVESSSFVLGSDETGSALVPDWIVAGPERIEDVALTGAGSHPVRALRERFVLTPTRSDLDSLPDLAIGARRFPGPAISLVPSEPIDPVAERPGAPFPAEVPLWKKTWVRGLAFLVGVLLLGGTLFVLVHKRRRQPKDRRNPWERAWDRICEAEHPGDLHRAVRAYLHEEHGLETAGRTTDEVIALMTGDDRFEDSDVGLLKDEVFGPCDLASFTGRDMEPEEWKVVALAAQTFCKSSRAGETRR